jgi:hypothetical protein
MRGALLQAGGDAQEFRFRNAAGRRDIRHLRLALSQRARLVHRQHLDVLRQFQCLGILDENA